MMFDMDLAITDDTDIRRLVEGIGLELINETKWKEIITTHNKASVAVASTAKYNLVLGIANYYNGDVLTALSFFKEAKKRRDELEKELQDHLQYFEITTRYSLGMISAKDYSDQTGKLEKTGSVGLFLRLERAVKNYCCELEKDTEERYRQLTKEIERLINEAVGNENFKLNARCELLLLEGSKRNMDHIKRTALVNADEALSGVNLRMRKNAAHDLIEAQSKWFRTVEVLKKNAKEKKNLFVYYNCLLNETSVIYEFLVCSGLITLTIDQPQIVAPLPEQQPIINQLYRNLERCKIYYQTISHPQNEMVALSLHYEILHFEGRIKEAAILMRGMEELAENYELAELSSKLKHLNNGGTRHEKLTFMIQSIFEPLNRDIEEVKDLVSQMKQMDEAESVHSIFSIKSYMINLEPIGFFIFPKLQVEEVLNIIGVKDERLKLLFRGFFETGVIPVANIFHPVIKSEGPLRGRLEDQGISSWFNIYRIRKAFYEKKFYRFDPFG